MHGTGNHNAHGPHAADFDYSTFVYVQGALGVDFTFKMTADQQAGIKFERAIELCP